MKIKAIETIYNGYKFRSRLEARWAVFFDALDIEYDYEPEGFYLGKAGWYLPDFRLYEPSLWIEVKPRFPTTEEMNKMHALTQGKTENGAILYGTPWVTPLNEWVNDNYPDDWYEYAAMIFIGNFPQFYNDTENEFIMGPVRFQSLQEFLTEKQTEGYTFSRPVPDWASDERTIRQLITLDKEYFQQQYNKPHPKWLFGYTEKAGLWADTSSGIGLQDYFFCRPNNKTQTKRLAQAYIAARQARFEHGETPVVKGIHR